MRRLERDSERVGRSVKNRCHPNTMMYAIKPQGENTQLKTNIKFESEFRHVEVYNLLFFIPFLVRFTYVVLSNTMGNIFFLNA